MKIFSDDGKEFLTIDDCKAYEEKMQAERERKEQLKSVQQDRLRQVCESYKQAEALLNQYQRDYGPLTVLTRMRI